MKQGLFTWGFIGVFAAQSCAPLAINLAQAQYDNTYCDAICEKIVDKKSDKLLGLNGVPGWTPKDAQTCSLYEGTKNSNPSPLPQPLPSPWPSTQQQQQQCAWAPGQVGQQCLAYEAAGSASGMQKIIVPLDMATAGICWGACLTPPPARHPLEIACSIAGISASAAEILDVMMQKSSPVSKMIAGAMSAAGIAGGIMELKDIGAASRYGAQAAQYAKDSGGIQDGSALSNQDAANGKARKMACAEAAMMTIMAVLRMKNMNSADSTRQNACNQVQALASSSSTLGQGIPMGGALSGNTGAAGASAAGGNSGLSNGAGYANPIACAQHGMGREPGGCGLTGQQLAAADAASLNSGLAQAIAPHAMGIDTAGLFKRIASGEDPGAIMGSALSGPGSAELADLAKMTSLHAAELGAIGGEAPLSVTASGSGGKDEAKAEGFKFDLGNGLSAQSPSDQSFSEASKVAPASGDIWHTDFRGSIFEIVTQKISSTRDRVEPLDWSTPLNRALAGSTSQSKAKP